MSSALNVAHAAQHKVHSQSFLLMSQDELKQLGPYELAECLYPGSKSRVYKARVVAGQNLNAIYPGEVAVKVYRHQPYQDDRFLTRFLQEGEIGAKLCHGGIISFYESAFAQVNGRSAPYHVMELGRENLSQFLNRRKNLGTPLSPQEALRIGEQIGNAIDYCHDSGVVLRDLKPTNILFCPGDLNVKIADFDNAWIIGAAGAADRVGVPSFAAPEHFPDEKLTARAFACPESDIFAFGKILYLLFTNDYPRGMDARSVVELPSFLWTEPWAERVCAVLHKATMDDPLRRYHSAADLMHDLHEAYTSTARVADENAPQNDAIATVNRQHRRRQRRRRLAFGAVVAALFGVVLVSGVVIRRQTLVVKEGALPKPCSRPDKLLNLRVVSTTGVNLRTGPSARSPLVCTMNAGTTALMLGETKRDWSKIRILTPKGSSDCESGMEGYSYGEFFKIDECG